MARINLLPWREAQRKERQRQFVGMAGGVVLLMGMVIVYAHFHIAGLMETQQSRNTLLEREIADLDRKIRDIRALESQKERLLARMNVIQQLQGNRAEIVHLLEVLAEALPDGVHYTDIRQQGNALVLQGVAQSNARVSALMRNLDASPWLTNPRLDVIQADRQGGARTSTFTLRVTQVRGAAAKVAS
ncbi:PilN domain-containing protein [Ectothiorhodospiraceae bacterium 2226]|nr:PilN domain-containing protein [Ectothiorhodospiraceae bacterium 2226]